METKLLDLLGIPMDKSRDELVSGGQKEEVLQQEIDTLTVDYPVSTEPIPDSSILDDASPTDTQKMEVEPLRHMEEVQEPILE